ncbi:glycosyltransferase family 4 protein [Methylobacterium platani]|uniref:Glycosyl transferase family 1 n=2 Tax=Methylobacterium platani TaxID=427683 RepID=A0A179S9U2_9HYPH|nr:glycosyltransferase family 1 protein [Methylobacterium platani]KMO11309.1 glycosyl transferase family 1 [Methylobacterium platani JCM 14648]OAS24165.1 glycosyl transferase family 1 [Methylobacterium platani]
MVSSPVAFDLTRLVTRLRHASPTGIDRVDLAYARHLLAQPGERLGLVSTRLGPKVLARAQMAGLVDAALAAWTEEVPVEDDPVYRDLAARLGLPAPAAGTREARPDGARRRRERELRAWIEALRAPGPERLPPGALYLHTSHLRLDLPARFDWLYDRTDVKPVFFVHDLIPIEYPEYGRPGEAERHRVRMETVARHARAVVVNSADVGRRFSAHLARVGHRPPPVTVGPLGIEASFSGAPSAAPARPLFLVCGTIEPRKNLITLLTAWRDLAARHGDATPRLVVVGRRGWESENVVDLLERCPAVRTHVTEVSGLSTAGLVRLMGQATALLMPSFAEGYGLPVLEAAAAGLPVVASDIPVHREIAAGFAEFLHPLDGLGWMRMVEDLAVPGSPLRTAMAGRLAGYRAPSWDDHFARVDPALEALAG